MRTLFDISADRSLFIRSSFDDSYIDNTIEKLFLLNKQDGPIFLCIDSTGGYLTGAIKLYEHILLSRNEVIGVVVGNSLSGASFILQACKKRYATPLSVFTINYTNYRISFLVDSDKSIDRYIDYIHSEFEYIHKMNNIIRNVFKLKMTVDEKQMHDLFIKDEELKAEKALKLGLIDEIIDL